MTTPRIQCLANRSVLRLTIPIFAAALIFSTPASGQIDQVQPFQQQSPLKPQTTVDCSQPGNAELPACQGNSDDSQAPDAQDMDQTRFPTARSRSSRDAAFTNSPPPAGNFTTAERGRTGPSMANPPELPSEFQRFVQSSTGELLPIYGASLFDRVPSTFAPVDHVPVTSDYAIGPSDEIDIRVWGQINFNQRLVVDRAGDIFIPQVGRISVSGIKFAQLEEVVKSAICRVYRNFEISVNMGQLRSIQILVVGQAKRPGSYTVSSLSTLVNALFASGGPSSRGSLREIQLKRNDKVVTTLDLYDLLLNGDKSSDAPLRSGDILFIPRVGPQVAISGSVESPGIYELKEETSLGKALLYAGGLSPIAAGQHAILERVDGHSKLQSDDIELARQSLVTDLQDGDIVRLLPVVPRFDKVITVRGNVADAIRLPWRPGMTVSDAIPNKDFLLTRDYWLQHNKLNNAPMDRMDGTPVDKTRIDGAPQRFRDIAETTGGDKSLAALSFEEHEAVNRHFLKKNEVLPLAPDIDWNYATLERLDKENLTTRLVAFNLGKAVIDHDPSADLPLEPGDIINVFSIADIATPKAQQTVYVRVEGEINMAGVYSVRSGETLRDLVARAGGLTSNAYLYGAQFTRESIREEQQKRYSEFVDQLERDIDESASSLSMRTISTEQNTMLQSSLANQKATVARLRETPASGRIVLNLSPKANGVNALPAIPLENGDRLLVPSTPSSVHVLGAVYNQSTFLYGPNVPLGEYLHSAGGPTRYADQSHTFVIRADGSVVAKDSHSHLFRGNFDSLRMYPGDSVVVPPNTLKNTRIRGFLDWSQVISNFGLGAAAVNVLK